MMSIPRLLLVPDGEVDGVDHVAGQAGAVFVEHLEDDEAHVGRKALVLAVREAAIAGDQPGDVRAVTVVVGGRGLNAALGEVEKDDALSRSPLGVTPESINATVTLLPVYGSDRGAAVVTPRFQQALGAEKRVLREQRRPVVETPDWRVGGDVHDVPVLFDRVQGRDRQLRDEQVGRRGERDAAGARQARHPLPHAFRRPGTDLNEDAHLGSAVLHQTHL